MAKTAKAVVTDETLDEGEVPLSTVGAAKDKGLSNGLGLERLFPTHTPKPTPKEDADEGKDVDEVEVKSDVKVEEKKPAPTKDPKTGRFLPKTAKQSEPPIEDAKPDDDSPTLKKRLKDTRDWASQVNKQNQELTAQVKKLESDYKVMAAKLDGTYVEPKKDEVDPVEMAKLNERAKISKAIAEQVYGVETVQELIYAENSPYRQLEQADPVVKARVFQSDQPVMEAIKQLKWNNFKLAYGEDPDSIVQKITEEVKAEFVKTLKEKGRGKRTIEDVGGLHDVGGHGEDSHVTPGNKTPDTVDLKTVFPGFPTGSF